jgi:hypothetical protein
MRTTNASTGGVGGNWARLNGDRLDHANYVRNTTRVSRYFIELLPGRLFQLTRHYGSDWCVIICGEPIEINDYWVIPYRHFEPFIREEYMQSKGKNSPPCRWLFQIQDKMLVFFPPKPISERVADRVVDIRQYYGNPAALFHPIA